MSTSSIPHRALVFLAPLLLVGAGCKIVAPPAEHNVESETPASLSPPDPYGVTSYRWEDVYAAGRLEWAWAIASDHGDLEKIGTLLAQGFDPDTLIGG